MNEQVKLYDVNHFEHATYDDHFIEQGQTIVNDNITRCPVRKYGRAPHELLRCYLMWDTIKVAQNNLRKLGFTQQNEIVWIKNE